MRHLGAYDWDKILEEEVPRTLISLEFLNEEKEMERKTWQKNKRNQRGRR